MLELTYPQVLDFYRAASGHLEAAKILFLAAPEASATSYLNWEVVYLSGCSVECVLRAWYLSGFSPREHPRLVEEVFKGRVRHNLEDLKEALAESGRSLSPEQKANLRHVRSRWSVEMRYAPRRTRREIAERVYIASDKLFRYVGEVQ